VKAKSTGTRVGEDGLIGFRGEGGINDGQEGDDEMERKGRYIGEWMDKGDAEMGLHEDEIKERVMPKHASKENRECAVHLCVKSSPPQLQSQASNSASNF